MSDKPKTVDSKAMLQAIVANTVSSTRRVSGEPGISQSSVVRHVHELGKNICYCWIVPHVTKISQNFWLAQV